MFFFFRKARRKEREGGESTSSGDSKLYLESAVLERKLPDIDMRILVDLPAGLDFYEWLASHSKKNDYLFVLARVVFINVCVCVFFCSDGSFRSCEFSVWDC